MLATRLEDPRRLADPRYVAEPKLDSQRAERQVEWRTHVVPIPVLGLGCCLHAALERLRMVTRPFQG